MIEPSAFVFKPFEDQVAAHIRELAGGLRINRGRIDHTDDIEVDIGPLQREAMGDRVGVLEGDHDDGAVGVLCEVEGAGVEGKELGIREVLVAGSLGSDADGVLAGSDVPHRFLDGGLAVDEVALEDGEVSGFANPVARDGDVEVRFFRDEENAVMAEGPDHRELIERRQVVMDDHDRGFAAGKLSLIHI